MCLNKNSFDLLLISIVFYTHNSLANQAENKGVLLNCLSDTYWRSENGKKLDLFQGSVTPDDLYLNFF